MIQCPICQMINDDQTRFCAECGARLGPAPSAPPQIQAPPPIPQHVPQQQVPQQQQAPQQQAPQQYQQPAPQQAPPVQAPMPPAQAPQISPVQPRLNSPPLSGAPENSAPPQQQQQSAAQAAEIDRLKRMGNRPEVPQTDGVPRNPYDPRNDPRNQQQNDYAQNAGPAALPGQPVKKLRSPLLAGDDDYDDDQGPGPISARNRQEAPPQRNNSGRQHLHSPLLGDAVHDPDHQVPNSSGRQHLHSPLLGDAAHDPENTQGYQANNSGRQHLHSPLLGDAVHDTSNEQNIAPASTSSGRHHLHSPLLGGGSDDDQYYEEEAPRRGSGLHSPLLGGGGGGGNSRGGLRSPMLGAAASGGEQYFEEEYDEDPYADEGNPNILRSPLLSSKMDQDHHHVAPKQPKGQSGRQQPPTDPRQNQQDPRQNQQSGRQQPSQQQQYQQPPQQQQYQQAPQQQPAQLQPSQPQYQQAAAQQYGDPSPSGSAPAFVPQQHPGAELLEPARQEAFPDMAQFRRDAAAAAGANPVPNTLNGTIVPVSLPMTAGIPDPSSYVPPELAPGRNLEADSSFVPAAAQAPIPPSPAQGSSGYGASPSMGPSSSGYGAPPSGLEPTSSSRSDGPSNRSPSLPGSLDAPPPAPPKPRRSSSKLLGDDFHNDDDQQDAFDQGHTPRQNSFGGGGGGNAAPYMPQQVVYAAGSPVPKMLGGAAVVFSLFKVPMLLSYLPSIMNPQYTWTVVDLAATTLALMALGLAALMSKN